MWEKKREPPNVTKVQSYVMLILQNVKIEPSNVRKENGTTKCDKSMVFKTGPFNEPLKGEVQGFEGRTEVKSWLNRDDVIINLIII